MLPFRNKLLRSSNNAAKYIQTKRTIFLKSSDKRQRPVTKKHSRKEEESQLLQRTAQDDLRRLRQQENEYYRRISELRNFTSSIASYVRYKESGIAPQFSRSPDISAEENRVAEETTENQEKKDSEKAEFRPENARLDTPAVEIPSRVKERLGPATHYLIDKNSQYWKLVMLHLQKNEGFSDLSSREVMKLLRCVPNNQILGVFPIFEQLMKDAKINQTSSIINTYLKKLVSYPALDQERLDIIESTVDKLRAKAKEGKLSTDTYEVLIEAFCKTKNIAKLEEVMVEMRKNDITPSARVYSSVLTTSVYQTKDHKQAVQLFDLMKFLAGCMAPKTRDYRDIIVSYINNDDIEKALDIYQEMRDRKIEVDQNMLVALARGCVSRQELKLKAWDFMFEIYELGMKPARETVEYMLYLAAKNGDLSFSRALYQQIIKLNAFSPRSLGFLMLAYASFTEDTVVPTISSHETGRKFRENMLNKVDYSLDLSNPIKAVPFLPKITLSTAKEVLSESSAIMAHSLLVNRNAVTKHNVNTYLNIAAKFGTLNEFKDRYEQFTYLDMTGAPRIRVHEEDSAVEVIDEMEPEEKYSTDVALNTKSPVLSCSEEPAAFAKIPRSTYTYTIALKAAAKHKTYEFAKEIWQERGTFRKTAAFTSMTRREKDALDFLFAACMVHCLSEINLLDDALAIVISTEYQFRWTWKELMPLHKAAVELGYDKVTQTVRGVASRAQIKFEGKIRRKDFKLYVMQNKR